MEHLLQKSKCSIIHNIFKCMIFKDIKMGLYEVKGSKETEQARLSLFMSKSYIVVITFTTKKNASKVFNTFENIMENGAFAPKEQMLNYP